MSTAAQRTDKQHWAIGKRKLENARKLRGILFHRSGRRGAHGRREQRAQTVEVVNGISHALLGSTFEAGEICGGNTSNTRRSRYACIVEKAPRKISAKRSGSQCCEGFQLVESLHSCATVHSYAPVNENPGCKKTFRIKSGRSSKNCLHGK